MADEAYCVEGMDILYHLREEKSFFTVWGRERENVFAVLLICPRLQPRTAKLRIQAVILTLRMVGTRENTA